MGQLNDLAGKRFGRLVVKERVSNIHKYSARWCVECDCGNIKEVDATNLRNGFTKSCGCLNYETRSKRAKIRPYESAYNRLVSSAKERLIETELTYEDYVYIVETFNLCHYCDEKLEWARRNNGKYKQRYNIDRKDYKIGYTRDNCVPCCPRCNKAKSSCFSYDEWVEIGKTIKEYRSRKVS